MSAAAKKYISKTGQCHVGLCESKWKIMAHTYGQHYHIFMVLYLVVHMSELQRITKKNPTDILPFSHYLLETWKQLWNWKEACWCFTFIQVCSAELSRHFLMGFQCCRNAYQMTPQINLSVTSLITEISCLMYFGKSMMHLELPTDRPSTCFVDHERRFPFYFSI